MQKISFWARNHIWTSRLIIILIYYPLLNLVGWMLGNILFLEGISLSPNWNYVLAFIGMILFLNYPYKKKRSFTRRNYAYRKTMDMLLACLTFCFILLSGNTSNLQTQDSGSFMGYANMIADPPSKKPEVSKPVKKEKKGLKKIIHDFRKMYKAAKKPDKGAIIALTVLVALLLIIGVGALACSIACGGAEALGYIVFILGTALIIVWAVLFIKKRTKGTQKKPAEEKTS